MEIAQATRDAGLRAADLAGATLTRAGGALIVRLADGRVVAVPGFFPHDQPPLPPDAVATGAMVLSVDDYYAAVTDASDAGSAPTALADQFAAIAPAAGGAASAPVTGSSLGSGGEGGTSGLRSGGFGGSESGLGVAAGGNAGTSGAPIMLASLDSGRFVATMQSETGSGGAAESGPQPPSFLSGLPLAGSGGGGGGLGSIANGMTVSVDAPPQTGVLAGSTNGSGGSQSVTLIVGGTFELSTDPLGYHVVRVAGGPLEDAFVDYRFGGLGVTDPKSATIVDPADWVLLRLFAFDSSPIDVTSRFSFTRGSSRDNFYFPGRELGFAFGPSMSGFAAIDGFVVFGAGTITLGDPHDPDLFAVFGVDGPAGSSVVASATNDYDFVGVDGTKFHGINGIDAANGVASTIRVDLAFIDAMDVGFSAPDPGSPFAGSAFNVIAIAADAADSVVFADTQNWQLHGVDVNGLVQYRAGGPGTFQIVEMPVALAAKPAYLVAGGAGDDVVTLPDLNIGSLDGGGGVDVLRVGSGDFDFTTLTASQSVKNFEFIDAGTAASANAIVVDKAFVAADGGNLTLLGGANDRATIADLATQWTQFETFTESPGGVARDFVHFQSRDGSATLNVQAELAQDLPIFRIGGTGNDRLTVEASAKTQTIDGGAGFDLLAPLTGADIDLTALAAGSSVTNIEAIDARGQGANAITLDDVFVGGATTDGVLSVLGEAGDTLTIAGGWTRTGSFPVGAETYDRWKATTPANLAVTLFIDSDVQVVAL